MVYSNVTNIPSPRVPVLDPNTGLISREWYRYLYNLFVLTGNGSNDITLQDLQLSSDGLPSELAVIDSEFTALGSSPSYPDLAAIEEQIQALALTPSNTPHLRRPAWGAFYDTNTQTGTALNVADAMTFNSTEYSDGVSIGSPTSRVYVDRSSIYNIQFSAQLNKTSGSAGNIYIWLDKNGSTIANTATKITLQGANTATVAAWNFLLEMNAGDYFRLMFSIDAASIIFEAAAASGVVPGIPSIILTVTDNFTEYQVGA